MRSPEIELLLCCGPRTSRSSEEATTAEMQRVLPKIDWKTMITLALRHNMVPVLHHSLKRYGLDKLPEQVQRWLQQQQRMTAMESLLLTQELGRVLKGLLADGIPALPYKGAVLASRGYGDLSWRRFSDLDFLVNEADYGRAGEWLLAQGYRQGTMKFSWASNFVYGPSNINVDLHQQLAQPYFPFRLEFQALWQRQQTLTVAGQSLAVLSVEDALLVLCVQLAKDAHHYQRQLIKVCDIAAMLQTQTFDWAVVGQRACQFGSPRLLWLGLWLAHSLFDAPVPEGVWRQVQLDRLVRTYGGLVSQDLLAQESQSRGWLGMVLRGLLLVEPVQPWRLTVGYAGRSVMH